MFAEKYENFLKDKKLGREFESPRALRKKLQRDCSNIRIAMDRLPQKAPSAVWLCENWNLLLSAAKNLRFEAKSVRKGVIDLFSQALLCDLQFESTEDVLVFLEAVSKNDNFSERELQCFSVVYRAALIAAISKASTENMEKIPSLISLFHQREKINFEQVRLYFSPLERVLRSEMSGVYSQMTRDTQNWYRRQIIKKAKKKREEPCKFTMEIVKKASLEGKHFGEYLREKQCSKLYFPAIFFLFIVFIGVLAVVEKRFFVLLFSSLPLYFIAKRIVEFFISRFTPSAVLPGMKCETVKKEDQSCVVITTLISGEKDIAEACKKINQYRLNNKTNQDHLFFGLLCDLPQGDEAFSQKDEILWEKLQDSIRTLNLEEDCFFAVLRKRSYHASEDSYVGYERKRGAIEQFVAFLNTGLLSDNMLFCGAGDITGTKYLITLDQDTELGIGQAKRLIGIMLHPLNHPVMKKENGRLRVVSGHGIIQPKITCSLLSKITTPYAKIFSNGSGEIHYATASYDTMQSLFGQGNFCGKGIIDVDCFYQVLNGVFPPQRILSHDMPEGALLRAGMACNEFFVDSDPQNAVSHYKRLHRWIRGDIQNLPFLSWLPSLRRAFALENILRYFVPIFEFFILLISFFSPTKLVYPIFVIFVYHFQPVFETVLSMLISGNIHLLSRRFKTKMRNLVLNSFYQSFLSISAILHEAIYFSDAIFRSAYRFIVSKKKLLEWQVYSPFAKSKSDLFFFLPSIFVSSVLFFFVRWTYQFVFCFLFLFFPFLMMILARKYVDCELITEKDRKYLFSLAKEEFLFFEKMVGESSSYLPPDNIQFSPVEKIANRTSPTNIGLYFVTLVSALELGFISKTDFLARMNKAFSSVEKMEHFEGHLFNWYDLSTLGVIGERFISTVDNGNYLASLIVAKNALKKLEKKEPLAAELITRMNREIGNFNFNLIFDRIKGLFFVGVFPDEPERSVSYYDLYMSESRITSFVGIALGKIPPTHWKNLSRPLLSFNGRVGVGSWTGTCFEYFMPSLFFPLVENSLEDESLDFAMYSQKNFLAHSKSGSIFGISESGYQNTDDAGNLQYYAFGTPYLSVYDRGLYKKVISPYSTFLMLAKGDYSLIQNLKRMENNGAVGPFGFYEALDFESNFIDDFSVVKSYMAHHKAMSIISLCNFLCENLIQKLFLESPQFSAKIELLAERFPLEDKILKKKRDLNFLSNNKFGFSSGRGNKLSEKQNTAIFTDGKFTILADRSVKTRFLFSGQDLFDPDKNGISCKVITQNRVYEINRENADEIKTNFGPTFVDYILILGKISIVLRIEHISGKEAFLVRLECDGISQPYQVEFDFDFIFQNEKEYKAHPAFQNLSLEGEASGNNLYLSRRLLDGRKTLQVTSSLAFQTKFFGFREEHTFSTRMLYRPGVLLSFHCGDNKKTIIPLIFSLKNEDDLVENYLDGSFYVKNDLRLLGENRIRRLNKICLMDRQAFRAEEDLLAAFTEGQKYLLKSIPKPMKREDLWRHGISGDYPLVTFVLKENRKQQYKRILAYLKAYKKLQIAGMCQCDLAILHPAGDGYFDDFRSDLNQLISGIKCEFLLGKHPGVHVIPYSSDDDILAFSAISKRFYGDENCAQNLPKEKLDIVRKENASLVKSPSYVGEFLENGFLIKKEEFSPDVPFSHVVSDPYVGFVCDQNSLGFTWFRNAGLNRISKWENVPEEHQGEKLYLLSDQKAYDLISYAKRIKYFEHIAIYEGEVLGVEYVIYVTTSSYLSGKLIFLNFSKQTPEKAKLIYSFYPALGQNIGRNIMISEKENLLILEPTLYDEYECGAYFYTQHQTQVFSDDKSVNFLFDCKKENMMVLGGFSGLSHLEFLSERLKAMNAKDLVMKESMQNFKLPDKKMEPMEFWSFYQAVYARFFARTGLYQSSGAFGFRDQLQDSLIFLDSDPEITRRHIIRSAAHQFLEGDVLHWWHTIRKKTRWDPGIRSRCSDDYLWLLFVTSEYIKETGDEQILDIKIPFLYGETLKNGEDERYINPQIGGFGTLREHLEKAALLFLNRGLGNHNLPDIGSGDWNDGMNKISGESVWLGFFGAICLNRCSKYFSTQLQEKILFFLKELKKGLEASFNGAWFLRAYRDDGYVFGSDVSLKSECSIDLITQSFAAFYQCEFNSTDFKLDENMVLSALKSAAEILMNRTTGTIRLFTKPFVATSPTPGYIQRYHAGVRENGGQYTHAAVWFAMALLRFGALTENNELISLGMEAGKLLDPSENLSFEKFSRYRREPYVLCGDIYDAFGFRGHGGWSWYSGAAGWYNRLLKIMKKEEKKLSL